MIQSFFKDVNVWQYVEFMGRILVACVCGAAIGFERSRRSKSAGMRTHIIVCSASALMMIVSKYGFLDLVTSSGFIDGARGADPARVAAQVISGISFLGAGIIVKHGGSVKGLTTAAGIWATAGIGLAIGAGMYFMGLFTMIVISIIQAVMHRVKIAGEGWITTNIDFNIVATDGFHHEFMDRIDDWGGKLDSIQIVTDDDGSLHYTAEVRTSSQVHTEDIIHYLSEDSRILRFSVLPDVPN